MIRFDDVTLRYQGASNPALVGVTLAVGPGELVVVLGANGSGKSTLARLANGLLLPSEGVVTVDAMDTRDDADRWKIRARVGFVQQNPDNQIVGTVVEEDVAFGPENLGVPSAEIRLRVDAALSAVGLAGLEKREPHLLSEGQKQRLAIASALALEPRYLVLDEPTSMLDPAGRSGVLEVVRALRTSGTGIVHITHHLTDAAEADRVAILERGRLVYDGDPGALLADSDALARFGIERPPIARLADALRAGGVPVPARALTAETVVAAL